MILSITCGVAAGRVAPGNRWALRRRCPVSPGTGIASGTQLPPFPSSVTSCCTNSTTLSILTLIQLSQFTRCSFIRFVYNRAMRPRAFCTSCQTNFSFEIRLSVQPVRWAIDAGSLEFDKGCLARGASAGAGVRLRSESAVEMETWQSGGGRLSLLGGALRARVCHSAPAHITRDRLYAASCERTCSWVILRIQSAH